MSGPSAKIILQPSRNSKPSSNTLRIKSALPADHEEENRGFGSALDFATAHVFPHRASAEGHDAI